MTAGFQYFLVGQKYAVRALVSIASLREFYPAQRIAICVGDDVAYGYAVRIASEFDCSIVRWESPTGRKARHHCAKVCLPELSPFSSTIFLDADTLVDGHLEELWPDKGQVVLTQFSDWVTTGDKISSRLSKYDDAVPDRVKAVTSKSYPAINTGVFSYSLSATIWLRRWKEIVESKPPVFMGDEIVANILVDWDCVRVLDDRFNASPKFYSLAANDSVRIWHYHGNKHFREGYAGDRWKSRFDSVWDDNAANVREWAPAGDKELAIYLESVKC